MTVTQHGPVPLGVPIVVHGWTDRARAGRALHGASAITTATGEVVASARTTWIVISEAQFAAFGARSPS